MSADSENKSSGDFFAKLSDSDVALLHEATLQDLLHCSNNAVFHLLWERNDLLRER
jgi:hypothetical protein